MPVRELGDPRLQALFGVNDPREGDVRPAVQLPRRGLPTWAFVIGIALFGIVLFALLNGRHTQISEEPAALPADRGAPVWESPPALYIPPAAVPEQQPAITVLPAPASRTVLAPVALPRAAAPQLAYVPQPSPQLMMPPPAPPQRVSAGSPLVIDSGNPTNGAGAPAPRGIADQSISQGVIRIRASAFANRSTTVPQGYLIPAVLETGFDSTKPGFARALVTRDVHGFDGRNVLVPRGSRLIGEYRSEVAQGQKRAIIIWTRLIRPDGMTIAMDSPAVDTVGRGGVRASVNTHFFERLGDALVQSTVEVGRALASRSVTGPVVVVPGNAAASAVQGSTATNYVPTLSVPAGKSISVFVAHDLDFSAAETAR